MGTVMFPLFINRSIKPMHFNALYSFVMQGTFFFTILHEIFLVLFKAATILIVQQSYAVSIFIL